MSRESLVLELESQRKEFVDKIYRNMSDINTKLREGLLNGYANLMNGTSITIYSISYEHVTNILSCIFYVDDYFQKEEVYLNSDNISIIQDKRLQTLVDKLKKIQAKVVNLDNKIENLENDTIKSYCEIDENGDKVTEEKLLRMISVLGSEREFHEERAVKNLDENKVYINASAALRDIGVDPRQGDRVYQACEKPGGDYKGIYYEYAERADLEKWLEILMLKY